MLRVGLTGGLGSGKSTVAAALRALGAEVIEADELGRALMEPGQAVFAEIVHVFGPEIVAADGRLDRPKLAELVFGDDGRGSRLQELNAIVHPAVIEAQRRWFAEVFERNQEAIAIVESALIFEVERDAILRGESGTIYSDWRRRMDRVIVVAAPDELKVARYTDRACRDQAQRAAIEADAWRRLRYQIPDQEKIARSDYVLENAGDKAELLAQVTRLWQLLLADSN